MTAVPAVLLAEEALTSRRDLTSGRGPDTTARRVVADAETTLELVVETTERGRTVDGWLSDDGLAWHLRGDLDTPRTVVVTPPAHLASVVSRMVGLGPRRTPTGDEVVLPTAELRAQLAGGGTGLPGGVRRVWSLGWTPAAAGDRLTVVDQGPGGGLWVLTSAPDGDVRLQPVSALGVWRRLAEVPEGARRAAAGVRQPPPTAMSGT